MIIIEIILFSFMVVIGIALAGLVVQLVIMAVVAIIAGVVGLFTWIANLLKKEIT